ncbi:hypothetical protein FFLO_01491 [Filobasidium floriforme]|uniref:Cation efflux protein transmembrane domain-containing protein n=1 Tax=Filobasidium floriforme TaxID=5210 RepID=A0A8K0NSL7_9TREE|nr:cation efflux family-domain-containing protein [Filobasidium floriforme]KAG7563059.1 hypothetical protein FFLO_01491 [Filobasidium floriforme]KAH8089613.1 cation efflux family-domain-containing protein [Filobasidium floriforme]
MSSYSESSSYGARRSFDIPHEGHLHRSSSSTTIHDSPSRKYGGVIGQLATYGTLNGPRVKHALDSDLDLAGLVDGERLGDTFEGLPVEEEQIKKFPKKLRPYYENMSRIRDHYQEVDELLSSALPSTIAEAFRPNQITVRVEDDADYTFPQRGRGHSAPVIIVQKHSGSVSEVKTKRGNSRDRSRSRARSERIEPIDLAEDEPLLPASQEREEKREKRNSLALNVNFGVNIILLLAKGLAVLSSSSVSLVASFVDAFLDFISTLIIFVSNVAMGHKGDRHKYPAGKKRFEPLGVLIFSVTMIASFVQVFIESFQRVLAARKGDVEVAELSWFGIGTMVATIVIKGIIWFWCSSMPSTAIRALAQDAENDVFFNIMSLGFPWLGGLLKWNLLDPIGGMVLSSYIIWQWCLTLHENFTNLSGKAADGGEVTRILYLVSRFKPVLQISYCEIYHIGDELIAEVDVVLPQTSTLHYAHDATETLQGLIESLEGVARAYVHADYSSENPAQHKVASSEVKKTKPENGVRRMSTVEETR